MMEPFTIFRLTSYRKKRFNTILNLHKDISLLRSIDFQRYKQSRNLQIKKDFVYKQQQIK
jgi:hypothetical protein